MLLSNLLFATACLTAQTMRSLLEVHRKSGAISSRSSAIHPPPLSDATVKGIDNLVGEIKSHFAAAVTKIEGTRDGSCSWEETFGALSLALGEAAELSALVTLPSMVHGETEVRAVSTRGKDDLKILFDETFARPTLYNVLASVASNDQVMSHLSPSDTRFSTVLMANFKRNGCALKSKKDVEELKQKRKLIEETCSAFVSAINENNDSLLFSDDELDGVDCDQYPLVDGSDTNDLPTQKMRKVSLKVTDTMPLLQFAKNANTRKTVQIAISNKCKEENTVRFLDTLRLRHECANLLGYSSHSHFMLEPKMASNPDRAQEFLLNLLEKVNDKCKSDLLKLSNLKLEEEGREAGRIQPWDVAYYSRVYKASLGIDEAEIKKYFPLDHVKKEILSIYEELLNLTFTRVYDAELWHPDVECYAVRQASSSGDSNSSKNNDGFLGYFYLDLFPRDGKYSHQCVYPLRPSYNITEHDRVRPACINIGNLSRGKGDKPSMLRFKEVETFFHEFGHVMHCVLSQSNHSLQSWAWSAVPWPGGVEQDFLEVPSMMFENFVWQPEILRRLSKKPESGESLPESIIEALSKSRFLLSGYAKARYLGMALYDLKIHTSPGPLYTYEGKDYDAVALYSAMIEDISGVPIIEGSFPVSSWYHPMMGYDAGYYSYIWSESFAADLFSAFEDLAEKSSSIIDPDLGRKYREAILSPCAMVDGESMLQLFLGREPSNAAFLNRMAK